MNSNTDHPLQQLLDWIQAGKPSRDAVACRELAFKVFSERAERQDQIDLALRLLPIFTSPEFHDTAPNPANRREFAYRHCGISVDDLKSVAAFWPDVLRILETVAFTNWESVLEAISDWLWPYGGNSGIRKVQRKIIDSTAEQIITRLAALSENRPGESEDGWPLANLAGRRQLTPIE